MESAASDFEPCATASPAARISPAISRPCRAIQTLCQVSITTASPRIAALNSSWAAPSNASDSFPVNSATTQAPSTPPSTPALIHQPRPVTARVTASTMPMMRPASNTSRKTMISAASMLYVSRYSSLYHERALGALVEIVEKFIATWRQCAHAHRALALRRNDLLDAQRHALKFHRLGAVVLDHNHQR